MNPNNPIIFNPLATKHLINLKKNQSNTCIQILAQQNKFHTKLKGP